jgi:hypothetical protein
MHRIDEQVVGDAAATIRAKAPDLSWVYLEYTDDMGHRYGDSPIFYAAVKLLDAQMERLWKAIQYREKNFKEDWMLVITTDHGRDAETGKHHGGQSSRERSSWMVTNQALSNIYATYYKPAVVDILPTLASFLQIKIPDHVQRELDGVPLIGNVSIAHPEVIYTQGVLDISWQPLQDTGRVKILLSNTNHFKDGGRDDYRLVGEVPLKEGHAQVAVGEGKFFKLVLQAPHNTVNRRVMQKPATETKKKEE